MTGVEVQVNCRHHWVIDRPYGPTSTGRCKVCGDEREFQNGSDVEIGVRTKLCRGCGSVLPATPEHFAFRAGGRAYLRSICRGCGGTMRQERKARQREETDAAAGSSRQAQG